MNAPWKVYFLRFCALFAHLIRDDSDLDRAPIMRVRRAEARLTAV